MSPRRDVILPPLKTNGRHIAKIHIISCPALAIFQANNEVCMLAHVNNRDILILLSPSNGEVTTAIGPEGEFHEVTSGWDDYLRPIFPGWVAIDVTEYVVTDSLKDPPTAFHLPPPLSHSENMKLSEDTHIHDRAPHFFTGKSVHCCS